MVDYTSELKTWGSSGTEYPDSYNYLEDEQPVDAWDNFLMHHIVQDLQHLIDVTNDELIARDGSVAMTGNLDMDGNTIQSSTGNVNLESGATISGNDIWHEGNDGAGSGLNADEIKGNGFYVQDTEPNGEEDDVWIDTSS